MATTDDKKQPPAPADDKTPPPPPPRVAADMIKLTNTHKASLGLPPVTHERAKQLGIELKQEHVERFLEPGENTIPAAHWAAVKDQAPVRNWVEEGMIYEGADKNAPQPIAGPSFRESLTTLGEDEAKRYVEASNDPKQLSQWLNTERRAPVREAIQRRLDALGAVK